MPCSICGETAIITLVNGYKAWKCGYASTGSKVVCLCKTTIKCKCAIKDLMMYGCRCGAMDEERKWKSLMP